MAVGIHSYAFVSRNPRLAAFFKQTILRRSAFAMAAGALALKQRLYVLSVGYLFTQAGRCNDCKRFFITRPPACFFILICRAIQIVPFTSSFLHSQLR